MKSTTIVLLALFVTISVNAKQKIIVPEGEILSHSQFKMLSSKQRKAYIVGLRQVFAKMHHKTENFVQYKNFFNFLMQEAVAAETWPRCMYAGYVITGTQKCEPPLSEVLSTEVAGVQQDVKFACPKVRNNKRQALCNPLLFGQMKPDNCVNRHPSATASCVKYANKNIDEVAKLVLDNKQKWDGFQASFNALCNAGNYDYLSNVNAYKDNKSEFNRAKRDIARTCDQAMDRINDLTPVMNRIKDEEAAEIETLRAAKVAARRAKMVCEGDCRLEYEYPNEYFIGVKTKDYDKRIDNKAECKLKFSDDGKSVNIHADYNSFSKAPLKVPRFENVEFNPCEENNSNCKGGDIKASNDGFELEVISPGENGKACTVKFSKKQDRVIASLERKLKKNKKRCMASIKDSQISEMYDNLSKLVADDACNIKQIDIKATKDSQFMTKSRFKGKGRKYIKQSERQYTGTCPIRVSPDMKEAKEALIVVTPLYGKEMVIDLRRNKFNTTSFRQNFEAGNTCFDSLRERVAYSAVIKAELEEPAPIEGRTPTVDNESAE